MKLENLKPIDLEKCDSVSDVLDCMSNAAFGGRHAGNALSVLKNIVDDSDCSLILTVSGAMTIAKLGSIFGSLISRSIIKAVIATGAVVTHSFTEEYGLNHFKVPANCSDEQLYNLNYNRIYDTVEPESNLEIIEKLAHKVFLKMNSNKSYGSYEIIRSLSSEILKDKKNGFINSSRKHGVNVYVPALTDSELGLYLFRYNSLKKNSKRKIVYDPIKDLEEYSKWICQQRRIAFLTIGGGSPRNWGQQMLPYIQSQRKAGEISIRRLPQVSAAVRICPDPAELGHLSGSTYSEGVTWGKFHEKNKSNYVEIHCDATIIFPILAKLLCDYVDNK